MKMKRRYYNFCGERALWIAIGVVLMTLILIQGVSADILTDGGVMYTASSTDRIRVTVGPGNDPNAVEFVLRVPQTIDWRKEIRIRPGDSASVHYDIFTQDGRREDRNGLYANELSGGSLEFKKAGGLGIMTGVIKRLELSPAIAGKTITFSWECDGSSLCQQSTLSGDLYYPHNSNDYPIRNSYFEVWKSGFLGVATFVTSGSTDGNGHFTVTFDGDCDCWVTVFTRIPGVADVFCPAQSDLLCTPPPGQSPTHHYSFPKVHVNNGESVNYGKQILPSTGLIGEGAYIADTILNTWLFVQSQTGIQIPQVSVQFPCGALCPGTVYFNPYVITDVYLKPEGLTNDVIVHEYGHAVMFAAYGGPGSVVATIWPVPFDEQIRCLNHSPGKTCGIHVAWTEGWAEFFTSAVLNSLGGQGAVENPPTNWDPGDGDEGMVAAALWDLYAPSSPSPVHFGVGFAPIFDTIWHHKTHPTFKDFYNDFRNTHPESVWAFNAAAIQNTINYNDPAGVKPPKVTPKPPKPKVTPKPPKPNPPCRPPLKNCVEP
jgi:hypothetical protein